MEEQNVIRFNEPLVLDVKGKEREENLKKFLKERIMFYIDDEGNVILPNINYENLTHNEWYKKESIKRNSSYTKNSIVGYYYKDSLYLYNQDYSIPNIQTNTIFKLKKIFKYAYNFYLGVEQGEIGTPWKGLYQISIYSND